MQIYTLVVPLLLSILIGLPFLFKSRKRGRLYIFEYSVLIVPVFIWNLLLESRIGSQSLSNIVEVYILTLAVIIYSGYRFLQSKGTLGSKVLGFLLLSTLPIVLRLCFPYLSE